MGTLKEDLVGELMEAVEALPASKVNEVLDYARFLKSQSDQPRSQKDMAEALWQTLQTIHLEFEPGELDKILAELNADKMLDLDRDDIILT